MSLHGIKLILIQTKGKGMWLPRTYLSLWFFSLYQPLLSLTSMGTFDKLFSLFWTVIQ